MNLSDLIDRHLVRRCCLCLVLATVTVLVQAEEVPPIWKTPVDIGGQSVSLPEPSFDDAMDADRQEQVLGEVAGKYPLDLFLRDSIVAPFRLERENIKNQQGERVGHRVDVWFVVHGSLQTIRDGKLFESMLDVTAEADNDPDTGSALSDEQLAARGIKTPAGDGGGRGFYRFSVDVIDRVRVEGVVLADIQSTESSHFASVFLDDRFAEDQEFPNRWRPRGSDAAVAFPYRGLAAYAKATRLRGHDGAILVECHAVVHEPREWFNGPNLLSSKLPLVTQDTVRKFRRAIGKQ